MVVGYSVGDPTIFGIVVESIKRYSKGEADLMWLKAILLDELQNCSETAWVSLVQTQKHCIQPIACQASLRELLHEFDKIHGLDNEGRAYMLIDLRVSIRWPESNQCYCCARELWVVKKTFNR